MAVVTKKDGSSLSGDRIVDTGDGYIRVENPNGATVIPKSEIKHVAGGQIEDAAAKKK